MNKGAIKTFAIWARNKLMSDVAKNAYLIGITKDGIQKPLPQSTLDMQYFDIGSGTPYALPKAGITMRNKLVSALEAEAKQSDYATAYRNLLEHTASTWFNRLCAIRFMEVNDYFNDGLRVLSSLEEGKKDSDLMTSPFDSDLEFSEAERQQIIDWKLNNESEQLFGFLLQKKCEEIAGYLPGLFAKKEEPSTLLINFSITDAEGVIHHLISDIDEENWKEEVQIIGWLYVNNHYPISKSDLAMIMYDHAVTDFADKHSFVAFITTTSWMYLKSFEKLRDRVIRNYSFVSLVDFGTELFEGKVGHNPIVSWITRKTSTIQKFTAVNLSEFCYSRRNEKEVQFFNTKNHTDALQTRFLDIDGCPIAYGLNEQIFDAYASGHTIGSVGRASEGIKTGNNELFLRYWPEINFSKMSAGRPINGYKWVPHHKGGEYHKWYGNNEWVINWEDDGNAIKNNPSAGMQGKDLYLKPVLSWSKITSKGTSFRYIPVNYLFDSGSPSFSSPECIKYYLGFLNSRVAEYLLRSKNPTLNCQVGDVKSLPIINSKSTGYIETLVADCIEIAREDWNSTEWSWDYEGHPLTKKSSSRVNLNADNTTIEEYYLLWKDACEERFEKLKHNEEELNRIFIDIYKLHGELTPEVGEEDITVRKANLMRDVKNLISYAVGCMLGRYSLDVNGLAYAGGDWEVAFVNNYKTFIPDDDNCIPITDEDYFPDDIVGRFVEFIKVVYGEKSLETNLQFIASALAGKGGDSREVIRKYFLNDFFKDHCKMYSVSGSGKRPIYWLFDSGKQNGFKALVYMHRWDSNTIATVRARYVTKVQEKYENELRAMDLQMEHMTDPRQKASLQRRKEKILKQIDEIKAYDELIGHLALEHIDIDLDDGVKVNHEKVQHDRNGEKFAILAPIK